MTRIVHELGIDQKQHRLVVVLDGGTTLTGEQSAGRAGGQGFRCLDWSNRCPAVPH